MAACTGHADCIDLDVGVRSLVAIESNTHWYVVSFNINTLEELEVGNKTTLGGFARS